MENTKQNFDFLNEIKEKFNLRSLQEAHLLLLLSTGSCVKKIQDVTNCLIREMPPILSGYSTSLDKVDMTSVANFLETNEKFNRIGRLVQGRNGSAIAVLECS